MNSSKVFLFDQEYGLSQEQVCVLGGRMDWRERKGSEGRREEGRREGEWEEKEGRRGESVI